MSRKTPLDSIQSPSPCSKKWEEMIGDDRVRFCAGCEKNVFNLSAMPRREAHRFAARNAGRVCIRYARTSDGRVLTNDAPIDRIGRRAARLTAGVFGAALTLSVAAAAQTTPPVPTKNRKTEIKAQNQKPAETSRISFTIYDPNGAVIPDVEIRLINQKTKQEFAARSDAEGMARFDSLPRGGYDIGIAAQQGFAGYQNTLRIRQPSEPNVRINLGVGAVDVVGDFIVVWSEVPLFNAIAQGDVAAAKQTIEAGFDVDTKDEKGQTALHVAVQHGNLEIIRFLLDKGAKVNNRDKSKRAALAMLFDSFGDDEALEREIIRLLAARGADPDARDEDDETLLMKACGDDDLETVRLLLEAGANPNLKNEDGETALDQTESGEIKRLLLRYGAREGDDR